MSNGAPPTWSGERQLAPAYRYTPNAGNPAVPVLLESSGGGREMHLRRGSCRLCSIALGLLFALSSLAAAGQKTNPLAALSANIREVTRQVTPAVVEILVAGYASGEGDAGKTSNEIARQRSSGSGVIVDPEVSS